MEKAKYNWSTFVARRRINVAKWLEVGGIKTYESLCAKCAGIGVEPPNEETMSHYFKKPKKMKVEPKPEPVEVVSKQEVSDMIEKVEDKPVKKTKKKKSKSLYKNDNSTD